jgi:hypothetical protein
MATHRDALTLAYLRRRLKIAPVIICDDPLGGGYRTSLWSNISLQQKKEATGKDKVD